MLATSKSARSWGNCRAEFLEPRRLLAGVTIVTHGFELGFGSAPAWLHDMALAVSNRAGGANIYRLAVGGALGTSFTQIATGDSSTNESVIELDWHLVADQLITPYDAAEIADAVWPSLLQYPTQQHPFAELPIHLIGHSRGGSVVSWIARRFAQIGVWVDQVTTLDPHPLTDGDPQPAFPVYDPTVLEYDNVIFADNYHQAVHYPTGDFVSGTANSLLSSRFNADGLNDGVMTNHSEVHDWYFGTIDQSYLPTDGSTTVSRSAWYGSADAGYQFSRIANGDALREQHTPTFGYFGLKWAGATRSASYTRSGIQWPNVGDLTKQESGSSFTLGQQLHVDFRYQDYGSAADALIYLDQDQNPHNGNFAPADPSHPQPVDPQAARGYFSVASSSQPLPTASPVTLFTGGNLSLNTNYYICARIKDNNHERWAYFPTAVRFTAETARPTATMSFPANGGSVTAPYLNATPKILKVTFADSGGSGLNLASITDSPAEFSLSGSGVGTAVLASGSPTLVSGSTYEYFFTGNFVPGSVTLSFPGNVFSDNANNSNLAFNQSFSVINGSATLLALSIAGPASLNENSSAQFTATASFDDGTTSPVTAVWSEDSSATSISSAGLLTASEVSSNTAVTVFASYSQSGVTKNASASVTVIDSNSGQTTELISNGGFESGSTGWNMQGPIVAANGYHHTGTKYAVLGEINNSVDIMYQPVTIPANATSATLSYWYNIVSAETTSTPVDFLTVVVTDSNGNNPVLVESRSNVNKDPGPGNPYYHQKIFDLTSRKGQTVRVYFQATMDPSILTSFKVDDVSFSAAIPVTPTLTSLLISGPSSVNENSTAQYGAMAVFSDGSSQPVTPSWSTSNSNVATVSSSGILTARPVNGDTNVDVLASYTTAGVTRNANKTVTVVDLPPVLVGLSITGPSIVSESSAAQYACAALYSDGSQVSVNPSWSVAPATYASISASGLVTTSAVSADQTLQIIATYSGHSDGVGILIQDVNSPEVRVLIGANNIVSGQQTPIDFGTANQGTAGPQSTFVVRNDGSDALFASNLTVPAGYSIVEGLATTISAGSLDSFTVRLDTIQLGIKSGQIRFDNNDGDENPFAFPVTGNIVPPNPLYATATNFAAGSTPYSVVTGDFNGDHKTDIATANIGNHTVSVMMGSGNGTFAAATTFSAGFNPRSVTSADFNSDGNADLAVVNQLNSGTISVLLGTGNGSFGAATTFAVGIRPNFVICGDFNVDGKTDLATSNAGTGPGQDSVSILLGNGDGTFGFASGFARGVGLISLTSGDFNDDGKVDLAGADLYGPSVSVLLGNGNGTFGTPTSFEVESRPWSLTVGDFDNDGQADIASASDIGTKISLLLGNGNGAFGTAVNFHIGYPCYSVITGDFNGDSHGDLATANFGSDNLSVLLGNGDGVFAAAASFNVGAGPVSVRASDFNGDGRTDLATANSGSNDVSILLNQGSTAAYVMLNNGTLTINASGSGGDATLSETGDTITVAAPAGIASFDSWSIDSVVFAGTAGADTLSLSTPLTKSLAINGMSGSDTLNVNAGMFTSASDLGATSQNLTINIKSGATVIFNSTQHLAALTVTSGGLASVPSDGNRVIVTRALSISGTGKLDLNDNDLILEYASTTPYPTIRSLIASARNGGVWTGNGVTSTSAKNANPPITTLGLLEASDFKSIYGQNATFDAEPIDSTALLVKYTYYGDTDFNDAVEFDDYVRIDQGYNQNRSSWLYGDFDLNGTIEFDDYVLIDFAYNRQGGNTVSFGARTPFGAGAAPHTSLSADLNNDGKPDLIAANQDAGTVSILVNNSAPGASTPAFAAKQNLTVGSLPVSVSAVDLNGDGKVDLAIANAGSDTLSLFLNTTTPGSSVLSFSPVLNLTTGSRPRFVTAGDFNGDGKVDLAGANYWANTISVLLNTTPAGAATPSFLAKQDFTVGTGPLSIVVGDFNRDGRFDLAIANQDSNNLSVLLNTGAVGSNTSSFAAPANFATGAGPRSIAVGDINSDGNFDLVVANHGNGAGNTISVLLNTTPAGADASSFSSKQDFVAGTGPISIAIGDVNNDGRADVAVSNFTSNNISVLRNTTAPGAAQSAFSTLGPIPVGNNPIHIVISDLNADGKRDLSIAEYGSNTVSVLLNTTTLNPPSPNFAGSSFGTGASPHTSFSADVNNDGKADLIVANQDSGSISVLLNATPADSSTPAFLAKQDFTVGSLPVSVTAVDLNGDGKLDLAIANAGSDSVSVFLNTTSAGASIVTLGSVLSVVTGLRPRFVVAGDFNGDGKIDLASANYLANTISVLLNSTPAGAATASFLAKQEFTVGTGPLSMVAGDFNRDGRIDLAVVNQDSNNVSVLFNTTTLGTNTASFSAAQNFATGTGPRSVALGDVNNDGNLDLVVANHGNGAGSSISVLMNTTSPNAATPSLAAKQDCFVGTGPISVAVGDLNNDGRADVAVANFTSNNVSVLLNTTAPGAAQSAFNSLTAIPVGNNPIYVGISDMNLDGKKDLVVANFGSNNVSALLNGSIANLTVFSERHITDDARPETELTDLMDDLF